mgnify:CR=1 FL=1
MGYKMAGTIAASMLNGMNFALQMSALYGGTAASPGVFISNTYDGTETGAGVMAPSGTSLINTVPIVFDVTVVEGSPKTATVLKLFEYGAEANCIYIDLTGGPYTFNTTGTFTIPAGGITISLAVQG